MDYSLLIAIHNVDKAGKERVLMQQNKLIIGWI